MTGRVMYNFLLFLLIEVQKILPGTFVTFNIFLYTHDVKKTVLLFANQDQVIFSSVLLTTQNNITVNVK